MKIPIVLIHRSIYVLQKIGKLQVKNDIDITNKGQHRYKKGKSTNTAGLLSQSLITAALDEDQYALMASIDLSLAFDVVNVCHGKFP